MNAPALNSKSLRLDRLDIEWLSERATRDGRHVVEEWASKVKQANGRFADENLAKLRAIWKAAPELRTVAGLAAAGRSESAPVVFATRAPEVDANTAAQIRSGALEWFDA